MKRVAALPACLLAVACGAVWPILSCDAVGAGTLGLRVGDELFIGSFAGDRILRVALGG